MDNLTEIFSMSEFESKGHSANPNNNNGSFYFKDNFFNFSISLSETINSLTFENCIFKDEVELKCIIENKAIFNNVVFEKKVSFHDSNFKGKTRFNKVDFKEVVNFSNTKFQDLADFWGSKFYKPTIFYKTDFLGITVFSTTIFKENVLFTYSLIEKEIIFRGTNFQKGVDLSLSILDGNINIFGIVLNDFKCVESTNDKERYEDLISGRGIIPENNKRETFRIIKKQLQNQGNQIESLKYAELEIKTYYKQINREIFQRGNWNKNFQNYIILLLNSLSNRNGKSWLQGILFTLTIAFIFFYFATISTEQYAFRLSIPNFKEISDCIKLYFEFLTPTHKVDFLDKLGSSPWTYFLDFIGRAFIAYGIYQTIQAFRKFKSS